MTGKIFSGSKGIEVRFIVDQDVSTAQELRIYYWTPALVGGYWEAEAENPGTILHVIEEVTEYGDWYFQGWAKLSNSKDLYTDILPYKIYQPIKDRIASS